MASCGKKEDEFDLFGFEYKVRYLKSRYVVLICFCILLGHFHVLPLLSFFSFGLEGGINS